MFSMARRSLAEHIAAQRGFELVLPSGEDVLLLGSSLVPGTVSIRASEASGFRVDVDLALVQAALAQEFNRGAGLTVCDENELYAVLGRAFQLCASLPDRPFRKFEVETRGLPSSTEAERSVLQRIGQNIFREALEEYWHGRCAITGIADRSLLRASHIKPWADSTDVERLDVYNGLLLAAHLDAAFDKHLITLSSAGELVFSSDRLSQPALDILRSRVTTSPIRLATRHQTYLAHHRAKFESLEAGGT